MRRSIFILLLTLVPFLSNAQKILIYTAGTKGAADYVEFTFKSDKSIVYKQGAAQEAKVQYIGTTFYQYEKAFVIQMPDNATYRVLPTEDGRLSVSALNGKDFKMLKWVHEGPVNKQGICLQCAINEADALNLLKKFYM
jgi:hypothetical protein